MKTQLKNDLTNIDLIIGRVQNEIDQLAKLESMTGIERVNYIRLCYIKQNLKNASNDITHLI